MIAGVTMFRVSNLRKIGTTKIHMSFRQYLIPLSISLLLTTLSCAPVSNTTNTLSPTPTPVQTTRASQPEIPKGVSVVRTGIVSEYTDSNFTLLSDIGRVVLGFDANTVSAVISQANETNIGYLKTDDLFPGVRLFVEYFETNKLAVKVVFKSAPNEKLYPPLSGTINEIVGNTIFVSSMVRGDSRPLIVKYNPDVIVIKKDGSSGNVGDLSPGMNFRAFCYAGTSNAMSFELQ